MTVRRRTGKRRNLFLLEEPATSKKKHFSISFPLRSLAQTTHLGALGRLQGLAGLVGLAGLDLVDLLMEVGGGKERGLVE